MKKALLVCAMGAAFIAVQAAHADTVKGTASFQDDTSGNLLGVFASGTGQFTEHNVNLNGPAVTDNNFLTLSSYIASSQSMTLTDQIEVDFDITDPSSGSGSLGGGATETQVQIFGALDYNTATITWNNPLSILLADGDYLNINLQDVTLQNSVFFSCGLADDCGNVDASFSLSTTPEGTVPSPTPEPGSLALLGTSILGGAGLLRRRFLKA
jgi:hypothetical protein